MPKPKLFAKGLGYEPLALALSCHAAAIKQTGLIPIWYVNKPCPDTRHLSAQHSLPLSIINLPSVKSRSR